MTGGNAPPVLEAAEHDLDAAAAPVAALVVSDRLIARSATWDARLDALDLESVSEPIGVVAAVAEKPLRLGQVVEQRRRTCVVADLAGGHEEAQRAAVRVGDGMQLGVHAALGAPDQAAGTPFFTRRLEAVR